MALSPAPPSSLSPLSPLPGSGPAASSSSSSSAREQQFYNARASASGSSPTSHHLASSSSSTRAPTIVRTISSTSSFQLPPSGNSYFPASSTNPPSGGASPSSRSRASSRESLSNGVSSSRLNGSHSRLNTLSSPGAVEQPSYHHQAQLTRPTIPTSVNSSSSSTSATAAPSSSSSPGLAPPISFSGPISPAASTSSSSSGFRVLSRPARSPGPPPIGDPTKKPSPSTSNPSSLGPSPGTSIPNSLNTSPLNLPQPLPAVSTTFTSAMASTTPMPLQHQAEPYSVPSQIFNTSPDSPPRNNARHTPPGSNQATPRRPSLLTQQILSSPAIAVATTASSGTGRSRRPTTSSGSMPPTSGPIIMGPPLTTDSADMKRKESLKEKLLGHSTSLRERDRSHQEGMPEGGLRLDTSVGALAAGMGSALAGSATPVGTTSTITAGGITRKGSLHRGRSTGSASEGWKSPMTASAGGSGHKGQAAAGADPAGWKSPTEVDEDEVIETADLMFGKDEKSGRKMINQYLILREIGRGQHGQVRLGQDLSSPEASRNASAIGISTAFDAQSPYQHPQGHATVPGTPVLDGQGGIGSPAAGNYWAIKIVDRQPRKKLPGMRKFGSGLPEASVANEKLKREIAILKKCRHPNVVRLREVIDAPVSKKIYLILEYCEGGEVKWKSEDGRPLLTVAEARKVFRDVVCGLEYLHHQGIIHRDIKPANLLYSGDGVVKISDFGVSHYSHVLRGDGAGGSPEEEEPAFMDEHDLAKTAGSPAFFAPELCYNGDGTPSGSNTPASQHGEFNFSANIDSLSNRLSVLSATSAGTMRPSSPQRLNPQKKKRPPITQAIDIWALGVTLYCFLFGKVPFDSTSEYALFSIIPTEDFAIPETMGADNMWTGGRHAFKLGAKNGLVEEACEVLDLLEKLLEKDPLKRITLDAVKRHPFTLRDISDKSAWLASTDPGVDTFVTVTNDDVAAAVTNSGSFRKFVKRSVKQLSSKLNIFGGAGSGKSRSRSTSLIQGMTTPQIEHGHMAFPSETASIATNSGSVSQVPSPIIRATSRLPSNSANVKPTPRIPSNASEAESARSPSPRPLGGPGPAAIPRRMSWLQNNSSRPSIERARSPAPMQAQNVNLQSPSQVTLPSSDDQDKLGRSYSERSTNSSSGHGHGLRLVASRQSAHLQPPIRKGSGGSSPGPGQRHLVSSSSVEALDQIIANNLIVDKNTPLSAKALSLRSRQSADLDGTLQQERMGRARSESNSSSGAGFHRIARLFSRNPSQSQKSNASSHSTSFDRGDGPRSPVTSHYMNGDAPASPALDNGVESLSAEGMSAEGMSTEEAEILRNKRSEETFASSLYSSRAGLSSPELSKTKLPPLGFAEGWDGRHAMGMSPERPDLFRNSTERPTAHLPDTLTDENPDWNGNLSDDDDEEDYGQEAVSAYDRVPTSIDDFRQGSWKLDSRGWRGTHVDPLPEVPKEGLGLNIPEDLAMPSVINLADKSGDSPATITGPPKPWQVQVPENISPKMPQQKSPTSPTFENKRQFSPPPSPIHPMHPDMRRRSMSRGVRGSPLRIPGGGDRAKSPLGRAELASSPRFMDALEDDEEEDGLEMDFGKRGRRASKPATPLQQLKPLAGM